MKWRRGVSLAGFYNIVNIELADKIDAIAYLESKNIKDVVNEAFINRVAKFEKVQGLIKVPKK